MFTCPIKDLQIEPININYQNEALSCPVNTEINNQNVYQENLNILENGENESNLVYIYLLFDIDFNIIENIEYKDLMLQMLDDNEYKDVCFESNDGEIIFLHKIVLLVRFPNILKVFYYLI